MSGNDVRNPEWPKGITAREWLDDTILWKDWIGHCRYCGRAAKSAVEEHDGFCPVPLLASALLRLEEAERRIDRAVLDLSLMAAELTRGDLGRMTALAVAAEIKRHVAALKADANADH